ncbi:MAG: hypothetical protein ACKD6O_08305 [Candidatus Bathyarchaeota archaeon]
MIRAKGVFPQAYVKKWSKFAYVELNFLPYGLVVCPRAQLKIKRLFFNYVRFRNVEKLSFSVDSDFVLFTCLRKDMNVLLTLVLGYLDGCVLPKRYGG